MSKFSCPVLAVEAVGNHPNADRLSLVKLRGVDHTCISAKLEDGSHQYKPGDLAVYIPSSAILPQWLLKQMGFWNEKENKGTLAGSNGNRVKPVRLRGIFSEGVLLPVCGHTTNSDETKDHATAEVKNYCINTPQDKHLVALGQDVSEILGVTKYEPSIPIHMAGEVLNLHGAPKQFDVENIKNHPHVLRDDDWVHVSEKLHGTFCQIGFDAGSRHAELWGNTGTVFVCSKGLGNNGLVFKNNDANKYNLYVKTVVNFKLDQAVEQIARRLNTPRLRIMGEIYGCVQDLKYGMLNGATAFRVFDMWDDASKRWLSPMEVEELCAQFGLEMVPTLASGVWRDIKSRLAEFTDGKSMLAPNQIREGCVIRETSGREDPEIGRVILKSISEAYLLRKDGSELT